MENTAWTRVEGMIIALELDPREVAKYLAEEAVVAQIEWYEATPYMLGLNVVTDGEHVGTLPKASKNAKDGGLEIVAGPTVIDFVEKLAEKYQCEVMLGDMGIDRLPAGKEDSFASFNEPDAPLRVVEISETPASAVPLMAAFEGMDVADMELPDGKRALIAQLPADRAGWYFGDVPLVALTVHDSEFQAFFVEDDDLENVTTYNWGMTELIIPGALEGNKEAEELTHELVGAKLEIGIIHDAVPGVDRELAFEATKKRGTEAIADFTRALGLPPQIAEYLIGIRALDEIEGADFHEARGVSNAIGRSVDIMITNRESSSPVWDTYSTTVKKNPWIIPLFALTEATIGTTLLVLSRGRGHRRTWAKRLGTLAGVGLLIDSVAELSLAKYVSIHMRRQEVDDAEELAD